MDDKSGEPSYGLVEEREGEYINWKILWTILSVLSTICIIVIVILMGLTYGEVKHLRRDIDDIANDVDEITSDLANVQSYLQCEITIALELLQSDMTLVLAKLDMLP